MKVIQSHSSCLSGQVHEYMRISRTEAEFILNSKSEFHKAPLHRVVSTTGLQEEQSTAASQGVGERTGGRPGRGARRGGARGRRGGT